MTNLRTRRSDGASADSQFVIFIKFLKKDSPLSFTSLVETISEQDISFVAMDDAKTRTPFFRDDAGAKSDQSKKAPLT